MSINKLLRVSFHVASVSKRVVPGVVVHPCNPASRRQEDQEFEDSLDNIGRHCLKKQKQQKIRRVVMPAEASVDTLLIRHSPCWRSGRSADGKTATFPKHSGAFVFLCRGRHGYNFSERYLPGVS
jgi:hypothetical protein